MHYARRADRIEFTVRWPVQGIACFQTKESELVLSDIYWQWLVEQLATANDAEAPLPFVEAVERGFQDPASLVEIVAVTPALLEAVRRVDPSTAPPFHLLIPGDGCIVPTPEQVVAGFQRIVTEAMAAGELVMWIE